MSGTQDLHTPSPSANDPFTQTSRSRQPRFWCHECEQGIEPLMAPDPTCPGCHGQFVEEIEDDDDPRLFMHPEHDDEEYSDDSAAGSDREFTSSPGGTPAIGGFGIDPQLLQVLETMLQQVIGPSGSVRVEARAAGTEPQNETETTRQLDFPFGGLFFGATGGAAQQQRGQQTQPATTQGQQVFTLMQHVLGFGGRDGGATATSGNPSDYVWSQAGLDNIITQLMEQAQARNAPPPASEDVINSLPMHKIGEDEVNNGLECAVCKEDFVLSEDAITLLCTHTFHNSCILPWLKMNGTCPVCRFSLVDNTHGATTTSTATASATATTTPPNQHIPGAYHSNTRQSSSSTGHNDDDPMWEDINDRD